MINAEGRTWKMIINGNKCADDHVSKRLKGNTGLKQKHWLCECDPSISQSE